VIGLRAHRSGSLEVPIGDLASTRGWLRPLYWLEIEAMVDELFRASR
jgi:hypothetical protein